MVQNKSTLYSLVGSLAVNMVLTMGAGSFLISINKSLATQKTYKLEFVKRKTPPPIKKKKIRKEIERKKIKVLQPKILPLVQPKSISQPKTAVAKTHKKVVHQEIKMASLQPKALPTIRPKMTVRQTSSARPSVSIPSYVPRQVQTQKAPARQSAVMHASSSIMSRRVTTKIPTARSFATVSQKSSKKGKGRVTPVLTGMKHASISLPSSPREIPNIVDRGALKGYIGKIQRIIENAKQYPEVSRKAGREGKVKVQFTIFRDGTVDNIKLITQTPYPKLNQEAIDAVNRAAPFSGFPESMTKKSVKVILPFRFELR